MIAHQKCDIPCIKNVCYNKNSITNIISMKDTREKFCVTMDSEEDMKLLVHMPNNIVKFKQLLNGLYAMKPNDENSDILTKEEYQFMDTLEENLKCFSPRQKNRSKKAQKLYEAMGTPTVDDLKVIIQMNIIKNNEVIMYNVNLAT